MSAPILELVSLTAGYGTNPIVRDFSTRLAIGSITTLIGGNGAGKSTLLRAIYGTNRWFSGQIVFRGEPIEHLDPWDRLKRGIGFVPQGRCNFPAMSVAENIKMSCYTLPAAVRARSARMGNCAVTRPIAWRRRAEASV